MMLATAAPMASRRSIAAMTGRNATASTAAAQPSFSTRILALAPPLYLLLRSSAPRAYSSNSSSNSFGPGPSHEQAAQRSQTAVPTPDKAHAGSPNASDRVGDKRVNQGVSRDESIGARSALDHGNDSKAAGASATSFVASAAAKVRDAVGSVANAVTHGPSQQDKPQSSAAADQGGSMANSAAHEAKKAGSHLKDATSQGARSFGPGPQMEQRRHNTSSVSGTARDTLNHAKESAQRAANEAQSMGQQAKEQASSAAQHAKETASSAAEQAKDRAAATAVEASGEGSGWTGGDVDAETHETQRAGQHLQQDVQDGAYRLKQQAQQAASDVKERAQEAMHGVQQTAEHVKDRVTSTGGSGSGRSGKTGFTTPEGSVRKALNESLASSRERDKTLVKQAKQAARKLGEAVSGR